MKVRVGERIADNVLALVLSIFKIGPVQGSDNHLSVVYDILGQMRSHLLFFGRFVTLFFVRLAEKILGVLSKPQ